MFYRSKLLGVQSCQQVDKLESVSLTSFESSALKYDRMEDLLDEDEYCYVFRALFHCNHRLVTMKQLKADRDLMAVTTVRTDQLKEGARRQSMLKHSNVVQFLGIIWEPNFHGVVLEYAARGNLTKFIKYHSLHPYLKAKLLCDISKGVRYLHSLPEKIIHSNLKGGSVLITADVIAKVSDFGLADWNSFANQLGLLQQATFFEGAACSHVSPERWKNLGDCNIKSDVYSYGILIWEIYTEKAPFVSMNNEAIKLAVVNGQRPAETLLQSNTPPEIVTLMTQCWQQEASERPEMNEVIEKLKILLLRNAEVKSAINTAIVQILQLPQTKYVLKTESISCQFQAKDTESNHRFQVEEERKLQEIPLQAIPAELHV